MPRPLRIEYEYACYHVMNRGRSQQTIYQDKADYQVFLTTLGEADQRFGVQIQCYYLMSNAPH